MLINSSKISVIIPAYQHANELPDCLESIFNQTKPAFEIIIVNDGSTDNTAEILEKYKNQGVKIINQTNQGANAARNNGFDASSGEYVIFCDADIVMKNNCLERMLTYLSVHQDAAFSYSSFNFGFKLFKLWPFDGKKLEQMPYIHTTSLIRRSAFPRFDEKIKRLQDWDLFLNICKNGGKGIWIDEVLFSIKPRKNGISEWLPAFVYKIPWPILGFTPKSIKKYRQAEDIVKKKYNLR